MMIANRIFRPFETLIDPLNLPITRLPDGGPIQLVWHFAKMFRYVLIAVTCLSLITASISLGVVWMLAHIVDGVSAQGAELFIQDNLWLLISFAVVLLVIDPVLAFIYECYLSQSVQALLPSAMRWQAHKAVEGQDVAFFEDVYAGQVASRIQQVTGSVQRQLMLAVNQIPNFFIQFFGSLALLFVLAWQLAMPVVCWIIGNTLVAVIATPRLIARSSNVAEASSRATGAMTDVYSNISIVKTFSTVHAEGDAIKDVLKDTIDTQHREQRLHIQTHAMLRILNALLAISIFVIGLWGLLAQFVSIGEFVAAATITRNLSLYSFSLMGLGFSISQSYGTIRDAMPVITATPTVLDKKDAPQFILDSGEIRLDNVSYSYSTPDQESKADTTDSLGAGTVIENLNLHVSPGEKVGLVGLSGAGKSTVISLLLRLRDVDAGAVLIDGQDVRDVAQNSLRKDIGVISQDIFLLNRSVRDNVRYGAPSASDDDIRDALTMAKALEFVEGMRDKEGRTGLDAHVGERGIKLSGGQRQRLAIARVILKDARIVLFDEATSALDSEAETEIQENLKLLMQDKTALVVAHRLSTISEMDRLIVLDKGQIAEQGTHDELIRLNGLYARLWHRQSGGFIES